MVRDACRDVRGFPPSMTQAFVEPPDVLQTKCWFCGTKYVVPMRGLNEREREIFALIYNSHPTRQFVDERIYAAHIWPLFRQSQAKEYQRLKVEDKAAVNPPSQNN